MKTVSVSCNGCGAPLRIAPDTRFVTCTFCDTSLEVQERDGARFTVVQRRLERVEKRTEAIEEELEELRLERQLRELDDSWEEERRRYLVKTKHGETTPSRSQYSLGLVATVAGVFVLVMMTIAGASTDDSLGVLGALGAIVVGVIGFYAQSRYKQKLDAYEAGLDAYEVAREELLMRMSRARRRR